MKISKNALAQALKIAKPGITRGQLFEFIEVPVCLTTVTRYWLGTYDAKPWEARSNEERKAALERATELVSTAGAPSKQ